MRDEPDSAEQLVEELAGLPDERNPALILVEAWCLADEHQVRVRVAGAEDDLRSRGRQRTARAAQGLVAVVSEEVAHGG